MKNKNYLKVKIIAIILLVLLAFSIYLNQDIISGILISLLILLAVLETKSFEKLEKKVESKKKSSSAEIYLRAFENSGIYARINPENTIVYANRLFCQIMHTTKEECSKINFDSLIKSKSNEIFETMKYKQSWEGTLVFTTMDDNDIYLNCSFIPIFNDKEKLKEILFFATDVTELTLSKTNIEKSLYIEPLTKLPNRLKLFTDKKLLSNEEEATYIIFDIDSFSSINNLYGNHFGDKILLHVARWLESNLLSKNTKLYKLEADLFVSVTYEKVQEKKLELYLKKLTQKIAEERLLFNTTEINISLTIGAAQSIANQLKLAQYACKDAKNAKNSYAIYDKKSNKEEEHLKNMQIAKTIQKAIDNDAVIPYFQPIYNLQTDEIEKYETLMRIKDKDGKILQPYEFLDIAKSSKHYPDISCELIQKSVDTFTMAHTEFSVNVSFLDITNKKTTKFILNLLEETGIGPWIVFELLESEGIQNYKEVSSFIEQVKSYGAKIAIDDFGSGYSNFERLVDLQIDFIKIDGSLIKNIDQNDDMKIITKTIVNFAKELGIKTIAEYVHSQEVFNQVKLLGVDYAQGYHIGKPKENLPI